MNKYHDPSSEYDGLGIFDMIECLRLVFVRAETFVVGYRRSFFDCCEFFLFDHFPVIGFL